MDASNAVPRVTEQTPEEGGPLTWRLKLAHPAWRSLTSVTEPDTSKMTVVPANKASLARTRLALTVSVRRAAEVRSPTE